MDKRNHAAAVLLVLLGAASYGMLSPVFKTAISDGWSVYALTFTQVLSGTVLLWLLLLVKSKFRLNLNIRMKVWIQMIAIGICGLSLTTMFYNLTLSRLDASLSIVLLFQYAWITILLESIRGRRWPTRAEWLSTAFIFAGTLLAVGLLERDLGQIDGWGLALGLLSAVTYSLFFFLMGFLPHTLEPFAKSAIMATASLAFVTAVQGTGSFAGSGSVPLLVWGVLMGALGTALPTVCFNVGIPRIGSGLAALLGSMELPVAVLAAYVVLGEPLSWWQGVGIALILAGILAAQSRSGDAAAVQPGSGEKR